jgi:Subtilase family
MHRICAVLLLVCCAVSSTAGERSIRRAAKSIPNQYIVRFVEDVNRNTVHSVANEIAAAHSARIRHVFTNPIQAVWLEMNERQANAILQHPAVAYVEEDALIESSTLAQEPMRDPVTNQITDPLPWHLDRIDQRDYPLNDKFWYACTNTYGSALARPIVYVVDSGIKMTHQDFRVSATDPTSRVIAGVSFFDGSSTVAEGYSRNPCAGQTAAEGCAGECLGGGHGTAVASIIGGWKYGVSKVSPAFIAVRTHGCIGESSLTAVSRGLEWIYDDYPTRNAPAIINMSNAFPASSCDPFQHQTWSPSPRWQSTSQACTSTVEAILLRIVEDRKVAVVVAAHNADEDASGWVPARLGDNSTGVITVGGTSRAVINGVEKDARWMCNFANAYEACSYNPKNLGSNYGSDIDIWAPAQNIRTAGIKTTSGVNSTTAERTMSRSGTSWAAPIVTGVAVRELTGQVSPFPTPDAIWSRIVLSRSTTGIIANPAAGTVAGAGPLMDPNPSDPEQKGNRFIYWVPPSCR